MTAIALDDIYSGQLKPYWWLEPFLVGMMVGIGFMVLVVTIISNGRFL